MNSGHWALLGYWALFSILHSGMATGRFKSFCLNKLGSGFKYYRLFYSIFSFFSLGLVLAAQFSIESRVLPVPTGISYLAGLPMGIAGLVLMAISIRKYFFKLSGVSVLFHDNGPAVLESRGLHKYVRHPLYLGTLLFIWSLFLFFPLLSNLLACGAITVYVVIGIRLEERKLLLIFGSAYEAYRSRTPMLIPGTGARSRGVGVGPGAAGES